MSGPERCRTLVGLVLAAGLLVSCSASVPIIEAQPDDLGSASSAPTTATTEPRPTATATAEIAVATPTEADGLSDEELAAAMVADTTSELRATVLREYGQSPRVAVDLGDDDVIDDLMRPIPACEPFVDAIARGEEELFDAPVRAFSDTFWLEDGLARTEVRFSISAFPDEEAAAAALETVRADQYIECFVTYYPALGAVSVDGEDIDGLPGDGAFGFRLRVTAGVGGAEFESLIDDLFSRRGRFVAFVFLFQTARPLVDEPGLLTALNEAMDAAE